MWLVPFGSLQRTVKGTIQRKPVEKMLLENSLPDGAEKLEGGSGDDDVRASPLGCRWTPSIPSSAPCVCVRMPDARAPSCSLPLLCRTLRSLTRSR